MARARPKEGGKGSRGEKPEETDGERPGLFSLLPHPLHNAMVVSGWHVGAVSACVSLGAKPTTNGEGIELVHLLAVPRSRAAARFPLL